ncbi:glycosyltransferase family 2 protein [Thiobacillus denitrificans]|uniref:Glycosyltransferase n=1 Tax=Thiobacillus denitrificans TaxID=36861 RepID=A0A106BRH6_THIDE|nr:glycosyltransferase family A protein [Thiobacillus denitrificans]KVW97033.1 glycosyltransferase [Thiobacillus denitrificans]
MPLLTFAFCTYNRADRLEKLVAAMRAQSCPIPFEVLAINNNSTDSTTEVLTQLAQFPGPTLRWVTEPVQGIVAARNRGIAEALDSDILVYIDDDEIPLPGLIEAAADAILNEGAECAGGRVEMDFTTIPRPPWLEDDLLGFLAAVNHGADAFWIQDASTPIWTANVAYDMRLFRNDLTLRFDKRFDRVGNVVGGGSDAIMFRTLLERKARIRYRPEMAVLHTVEEWRLTRSYFLKLHYRAGLRHGQHRLPTYHKIYLGLPPFLVTQFLRQAAKAIGMQLTGRPGALRQGMNASHAFGALMGYRSRS